MKMDNIKTRSTRKYDLEQSSDSLQTAIHYCTIHKDPEHLVAKKIDEEIGKVEHYIFTVSGCLL